LNGIITSIHYLQGTQAPSLPFQGFMRYIGRWALVLSSGARWDDRERWSEVGKQGRDESVGRRATLMEDAVSSTGHLGPGVRAQQNLNAASPPSSTYCSCYPSHPCDQRHTPVHTCAVHTNSSLEHGAPVAKRFEEQVKITSLVFAMSHPFAHP
jgi:hypothetical protein